MIFAILVIFLVLQGWLISESTIEVEIDGKTYERTEFNDITGIIALLVTPSFIVFLMYLGYLTGKALEKINSKESE